RHAKGQSKIVFANDFPTLTGTHAERRVARNIPAVIFEAADQAITGGAKKPVLLEIAYVILEQYEARPPLREIKSAKHLELVPFHVDRQEIELARCTSLNQNVIERPHWDFDDPFRLRTGCHSVAVERRQCAGDMKRHAPAGILRRGASHGK